MQELVQNLTLSHLEMIINFERTKAAQYIGDPIEREMQAWNAPWREEALRHYLTAGWSAGIFNSEGKLLGYFLGQAFLFYQGLTQVLWVEHISGHDLEIEERLIELATRLARDRHLQSVFLFQNQSVREIKTTRR